jgi:hypothetical protein
MMPGRTNLTGVVIYSDLKVNFEIVAGLVVEKAK